MGGRAVAIRLLLVVGSIGGLLAVGSAQARAALPLGCASAPGEPPPAAGDGGPPLTFGIYPGGGLGTVGPTAPGRPEDPLGRHDALDGLRVPGRPLVLHLYDGYFGGSPAVVGSPDLDRQIAAAELSGDQIELVVTYRPADRDATADVPGFAGYVRRVVDRYGGSPLFRFLQVTDEANVSGAPAASDGDYPGAPDALIAGIVAARQEATARGFDQVSAGFNWSLQANPVTGLTFWSYLSSHAGPEFHAALGWVGLDAYPDTFGAIAPDLLGDARDTMITALRDLRGCYLPAAGIGREVPLHISENGWPTGPGRSESQQASVLRAEVEAVSAYRSTYGVSDYRWFDLRDGNSSDASIESHYGLMRDDYTPKPAYAAFRDEIQRLSRLGPAVPALGSERGKRTPRGCASRRALVLGVPWLRGSGGLALLVSLNGRIVRRLSWTRPPRTFRLPDAPPSRTIVTLRARRGSGGRRVVTRRYAGVCRAAPKRRRRTSVS